MWLGVTSILFERIVTSDDDKSMVYNSPSYIEYIYMYLTNVGRMI